MSEVKNVTITVPVGLNGWQQTGSVVINGMKVEFPVGEETQVPETAAALLKELIEAAEKRGENVPANNDYRGSLVVPAGHTLRVEKGANFLNYGDSVETRVILPETVMHKGEDNGNTIFLLPTKPSAPFEHGKTYGIGYNGTVYECVAINLGTALDGVADGQFVFGNVGASGMPDVPDFNPDAPFFMLAVPEGQPDGETGTTYAMLLTLDGAEAVTLSITEKVKVESAGGGVFNVRTTATVYKTDTGHDFTAFDKTYAEMAAAHEAGGHVRLVCTMYINGAKYGDLIGEVVATQYTNLEMTEARETPIFGIRIPMGVLAAKTNVHYWLSEGKNGEIVANLMSE